MFNCKRIKQKAIHIIHMHISIFKNILHKLVYGLEAKVGTGQKLKLGKILFWKILGNKHGFYQFRDFSKNFLIQISIFYLYIGLGIKSTLWVNWKGKARFFFSLRCTCSSNSIKTTFYIATTLSIQH